MTGSTFMHAPFIRQVPEEVPEPDGVLQVLCNFDAVVYDNLSRVADADVLSTTVADAARSLSALDAREAILRNSLEQLEGLVEVRMGCRRCVQWVACDVCPYIIMFFSLRSLFGGGNMLSIKRVVPHSRSVTSKSSSCRTSPAASMSCRTRSFDQWAAAPADLHRHSLQTLGCLL